MLFVESSSVCSSFLPPKPLKNKVSLLSVVSCTVSPACARSVNYAEEKKMLLDYAPLETKTRKTNLANFKPNAAHAVNTNNICRGSRRAMDAQKIPPGPISPRDQII